MHRNIRHLIFLSIFFLSSILCASEKPKGTICLNMIIKNESQVIVRCLSSLKHIIDYWVIVDTGSTDGTQQIVKDYMKDVPGELHERPWQNFAHNRNEALNLAKGKADYIMFIDADEIFKFDQDFVRPDLTKDFYYITTNYGGTSYYRVGLVKDGQDWHWEGVVHEAICSDLPRCPGTIVGMVNIPTPDGARSRDPEKYLKDALLLEAEIARNPEKSRHRNEFYLAQSYKDYGNKEKALQHYQNRVAMGGWHEEVFWSMLQVALLQEALEYSDSTVEISLFSAQRYRPSRIEPDYYLANHYRRKGDYKLALFIAERGLAKPRSKDNLFIQDWIYDYALLFEYSICAYWVGKYDDCVKACEELLARPNVPANFREQIVLNKDYAAEKKEQIDYYKKLSEFMVNFQEIVGNTALVN